MNRVSGLSVLNDVQENQKMLSKLPKWLTTRLTRVAYKSREEKQEFPTFSEFVKFLVTESTSCATLQTLDPVNLMMRTNEQGNQERTTLVFRNINLEYCRYGLAKLCDENRRRGTE